MEKKNSCVRAGFSTILWGVLAVLLCAAPCVWADWYYQSGTWFLENTEDPCDIKETISGNLSVKNATANLLTGASVSQSIYVQTGGTLNMYAGTIGIGWFISIGLNAADMTVYGTGFATDGTSLDYGEWTPPNGSAVLTGEYGDGSTINLWIMSNIPIKLAAPSVSVAIDIKPGSDLNPINPGSNGLIPVAILTTDDFDAADVDPATVTLAGAEVAVRGKAEKLMARLEDIDGDGDDDLLLQVETQSEGALWESGPVTLEGKTYGGQDIEGTDEVIIVPPVE